MYDHCVDEGVAVTCILLAIVVRFLMVIPTNVSNCWLQVSRLPYWHELEEKSAQTALLRWAGVCHLPEISDLALIPNTRHSQINRVHDDNFIMAEKIKSALERIVISKKNGNLNAYDENIYLCHLRIFSADTAASS